MQITCVSKNSYDYYNSGKLKTSVSPSFGEWYRDVYKTAKGGKRKLEAYGFTPDMKDITNIAYRNNTAFFRNGDEIPMITDLIVNFYKNVPKIHTRFYGCSNGAEVYSVYMYLLSEYGEDVLSKFRPLNAFDIDRYAVKKAKNGALPVSFEELTDIQKYTGGKFNDFFQAKNLAIPNLPFDTFKNYPRLEKLFSSEITRGESTTKGRIMKLNAEYLKDIHYSAADVTKDCKNIEPENSVISLRNFLPYLNNEEIIKLVTELGKLLKKDCCVILGDYDINSFLDLTKLLYNNGFRRLSRTTDLVFKKVT